jgi:archaellum component FlaC
MTTYLGEKAVGVGTVKATMSVGKVITDDKTILGDGFTEPLAVNTLLFATSESVAASAEAVRTEFNNKLKVVDSAIDGQADAIAKTRNDFEVADQNIRADMNEKDSELEHMITEHAEELTTLRGNQASLGDQVSNIESKIPQSASGSNPLITKQQLLDEEMDIRDDYNELVSELQTQITAQAGAIAGKQDKLTAGENITIEDGVISATGGGGASLPDQTGNKGKFLMTDGTNVSWAKVYKDQSTGTESVIIGRYAINATKATAINTSSTVANYSVVIGYNANSTKQYGIAIGFLCSVRGEYAIQLGRGRNDNDNTFKVGLSDTDNYELLSADGTIPAARHATLPTEDGTYVLKCVISGGVPTMTWVKE